MATTTVRWPHDVHVLVTPEMAKRIGHQVGRLVHVHAGEAFEMDAAEAKARIEAGDVIVEVAAGKPAAKPAQADKQAAPQELHGTEA